MSLDEPQKQNQTMYPVLVGITGASGSIYALRLIQHLEQFGVPVEVVVTPSGEQVLRFEKCGSLLKESGVLFHNVNDFFAKPASGSARYTGMVVVPGSMGTIGKIAAGTGDNLLVRAADVFLKEKRKLILVPRETPFNAIHLENLLKLDRAGAVVMPASPHFYHHPQDMDELVDTVVDRILRHLNEDWAIQKSWGES